MKALFAGVAITALVCCGGGGSGGAPDPDTVIPLSWEAGDRTAVVMVEHQFVDPDTLGPALCGWYLQLGNATTSGELRRADQEGACIVTDADVGVNELRTLPGQEAFCGGTVQVIAGGLNQTLTICGERIPDRMDLDCADLDSATTITASSLDDETSDDQLGAFTSSVDIGRIPDIQAPVRRDTNTADWPVGDFLVGWGGVGAQSVEIVIRERMGTGPAIRCFVPDEGSFVVPDRLIDSLRGQIISLEVARVTQTTTQIGSVEVRMSSRTSDALWLFPNFGE